MPGVPTSKGCEGCRRRKKGCDLVQPTCGRCAKLGIKCINNGTGRLKFVDETKNWSQSKGSSSSRPAAAGRASAGTSPRESSSSSDSSPEPSTDIQLSQLTRTAILDQAVGSFWDAYLPRSSGIATSMPRDEASSRWLRAALREAHTDQGLGDAVKALAMSRASRITGKQDARRDALMFYGSCVLNVRRAIAAGDRLYDDTLLATVMLLATFELHEGTRQRDKAWTSHVNGASLLINARGADSFRTQFGKALYLGHLRDELIYGIGSRGKSRHGVDRTSYMPPEEDKVDLDVQLVSILSSLPSIMETADHIRTITDLDEIRETTLTLRAACHEVMDALEAFDESLQWSQDDLLYWEEPSALYAALPPDSEERVMPTYLQFCDFPTACLQLTTWTSLLLMHSTLWLTYMWLRQNRPEAAIDGYIPVFVPPDKVAVCDKLASDIVKCMEYFVRPEAGLIGAQQISYPISIVLGYLTFWNRPERLWFPVIFRRLCELNVGIEGFLADSFKGTDLKMIRPLVDNGIVKKEKSNIFTRVAFQYQSTEE